jgi:hypothetical protein
MDDISSIVWEILRLRRGKAAILNDALVHVQWSSACNSDNLSPSRRRLAMRFHGWSTHREEIEFIMAAVLLWVLMMVAIHDFELRSVGSFN